jgi:ABC-type sulfate transport system permease subunit
VVNTHPTWVALGLSFRIALMATPFNLMFGVLLARALAR